MSMTPDISGFVVSLSFMFARGHSVVSLWGEGSSPHLLGYRFVDERRTFVPFENVSHRFDVGVVDHPGCVQNPVQLRVVYWYVSATFPFSYKFDGVCQVAHWGHWSLRS